MLTGIYLGQKPPKTIKFMTWIASRLAYVGILDIEEGSYYDWTKSRLDFWNSREYRHWKLRGSSPWLTALRGKETKPWFINIIRVKDD